MFLILLNYSIKYVQNKTEDIQAEWFPLMIPIHLYKLSYLQGKLNTYRFCDNVWTFVLNNVDFRDVQELAKCDKVKIVACDGKSKNTYEIVKGDRPSACSNFSWMKYTKIVVYSFSSSGIEYDSSEKEAEPELSFTKVNIIYVLSWYEEYLTRYMKFANFFLSR